MRTLTFVFASLLILTGCDSDSSGTSAQACESAMTKLCDQACACTQGGGCDITVGMGSLIDFVDRDDCLDWYVGIAVCPNRDQAPAGFFEDCSAALDSAQCETDPDDALLVPDACIGATE